MIGILDNFYVCLGILIDSISKIEQKDMNMEKKPSTGNVREIYKSDDLEP